MNTADFKKAKSLSAELAVFGGAYRSKQIQKTPKKRPIDIASLLRGTRLKQAPKVVVKRRSAPIPTIYPYGTLEIKDGVNGRDGKDADEESIIARVLDALRAEIPHMDEQALLERFIDKIRKERLIDVSHIRNSEQFIFSGTKYKFSELMHGGGSSGSSGTVYYTPIGTVNASNTVFTVTAEPTSVIADGITYFANAGYTYAALTITMDIPPSQYVRYTL